MGDEKGYWRWNVNPTWHHHSSMIQEHNLAKEAKNEFAKYHHLRACLYFSTGAIEALLNEKIRVTLKDKGDEYIYRLIRNTKFKEKIKKWPSIICGKNVIFSENFNDVFFLYNDIRCEVTHPKRKDNSIYRDLDNANTDILISEISEGFATIYEGLAMPFPYWILGWNYVGLNNITQPCILNNQNGFIWSMRCMGYNLPTDVSLSGIWEKKHMTTIAGYRQLKKALGDYPYSIEPFFEMFPLRPRLTSRWWDSDYIISTIPEKDRKHIRL